MRNREKCKYPVCNCKARIGNPFCSDYCEQAVSQAVQKDFCQCAHALCDEHSHEVRLNSAKLPRSIYVAPGQVTIEYSSVQHLREQVMLLAEALDDFNQKAVQDAVEAAIRRPSLSEHLTSVKAQSA